MSDLYPHNLGQPGPSLEETVALAKREGHALLVAVGDSLRNFGKGWKELLGNIGFHSPAPQEEARYSDEFRATMDTLTRAVTAAKITIGAPQSKMKPYQPTAEYEEMLLTD